MARRSLSAGTLITMLKGESFKGYYLQSKSGNGTFESDIHHFIAYEDFDTHQKVKDSNGQLQDLKIKKGQQFGMWGNTMIDSQIVELAGGQYCEVQFTDTKPSKKGNDVKVFDIFVDDEVPNLDKSRVSAASNTLSDDEEEPKGEEESLDDLPF